MTTRAMMAMPLLLGAVPAQAATGHAGAAATEAGPIALLGVAAAIAWHFAAGYWHRTHGAGNRHVFIRVMPAHALVPVLSKFHLDRAHLELLRRRARRLVNRR